MSIGSSKSTRRDIRGSSASSSAKSGTSSTATGEDSDFMDLQSTVGNAALAALVAAGSESTASQSQSTRFTGMQRATLLASNERLLLAAMVYSESMAATEVTDEMRALAAVGQNRVDHMLENPEDQELFGSTNMQDVVQDPLQFEEYGQSSYMTFNDAARFNSQFKSESDLQHALAAIEAAAEIENAGNPFSDDYLVFSADDEVQHSERLDESSKVTYGALTFWAFTAPTIKKLEEEETAAEVEQTGEPGAA
jgi:hypothetical protein